MNRAKTSEISYMVTCARQLQMTYKRTFGETWTCEIPVQTSTQLTDVARAFGCSIKNDNGRLFVEVDGVLFVKGNAEND